MSKTPTIDDIALALGMHKSTVSKALSGKGNISARTRARVRTAAAEFGYEPDPVAQRLASGYRNPTVYILGAALDLGLATQKIRLIQHSLAEQGLEVPIYTCPEPTGGEGARSQAAQARQVCRQRPRAVVCAAQNLAPDVFAELDAYQRAGGTVVAYDTPVPLACDQVVFDVPGGAASAGPRTPPDRARHLAQPAVARRGGGHAAGRPPAGLPPRACRGRRPLPHRLGL
jgi:DNA-binding LacI/PurR family transcriptional regulator